MNLPQQLLQAGFICQEEIQFKKYKFNPANGWLGCTSYSPDHSFLKGNKEVLISFGVMAANYADRETINNLPHVDGVFDGSALRLILLKEGSAIVYKTLHGEMPSDELIQKFIN